ncbi:flagellar protein FliT [Massilia sp. KIM]|jgi:flagellar protein FliT|uniref:flagellar protein FliT n=1 Tax=Massilia sp. KIM TaxID=1955422 RepID=UPI001E411FE0|nr:flagellar protein FliT [Massilia sp. KIM]
MGIKMSTHDILAVYESMVDLSRQMLDAAVSSDWDRLVQLEDRAASQVARLQDGERGVPFEGEQRVRKIAILKQLLDDDRRIRDLAMPKLAELSALISNTGNQRRLAHAYGV